MNVDRENRERLVEAIHRYLNDETTAFQFDRPELKSRRIRTPSRDWILRLQWGVVFLTFAPLVLFAQVFPEAETRSTVELHRT